MTERLVDVSGPHKTVLHTFPITIGGPDNGLSPHNSEYEKKVLTAAAHAGLVADADLASLTARMHVSRSGPLEPSCPRRSKAWIRWFESGHICFGRWITVRAQTRMNTGVARADSIFKSGPMSFGSRRAARRGRPTTIGTGPRNISQANAPGPTRPSVATAVDRYSTVKA